MIFESEQLQCSLRKLISVRYSCDMAYFTYIVECANGSLYTGWTDDVEARVKKHNEGKGARYTRAYRPVALVACWELDSKSSAMKFESRVKKLSSAQKRKLVSTLIAPEALAYLQPRACGL